MGEVLKKFIADEVAKQLKPINDRLLALESKKTIVDKNTDNSSTVATFGHAESSGALTVMQRKEVSKQIAAVGNKVYAQIVKEINQNVIPEVNKVVDYVHFQLQDDSEMINDYRHGIEQEYSGRKTITDGKCQAISEHIRLAFDDYN